MIDFVYFQIAFCILIFLLWLVIMATLDVFIPASQDKWSSGQTVLSFFRVLILHSLPVVFFIIWAVFLQMGLAYHL